MSNTKSPSRLIILPSLLAVCLGLGACQQSGLSSDTNSNTADSDDNRMSNFIGKTPTPELSDEQRMIDSLSRYRWVLATAIDSTEQSVTAFKSIEDQVTLSFNHDQSQRMMNYSVGCNTMSAAYKLRNQTILIDSSMGTKMLCEDLEAAENLLNELMQGSSQIRLNEGKNPSLTQVTSENSTLVWRGKMTAQAKYNVKGDTVFWAVAAESIPCKDNKAQLCLQVKPITYNEQGIKAHEGEWAEFAGTIDGYSHDDYDGMQEQVLRLQRFRTDIDTVFVDNIDSNYAYVLDTVIESTLMKNKGIN